MLSKLLKYEIKATGRVFLPLFLALLVFAVITRFISSLGPEKMDTPTLISLVIYIIIMVGIFVMTFIMMVQRFYKNLLSDEGYLMLTLPTTPWRHITSKLLISMMWMIVSAFVAMISILIIASDEIAVTQIIRDASSSFHEISQQLGASIYLLSLEVILGIFISLASSILIIYASIAVGHLFSQHKMLASFGAFIVLNTLSQIIFVLIGLIPGSVFLPNIHISTYDFLGLQTFIEIVLAYGIIVTGALCAAYFTITNIILSKRLNLE